jgi:hypothetical protein
LPYKGCHGYSITPDSDRYAQWRLIPPTVAEDEDLIGAGVLVEHIHHQGREGVARLAQIRRPHGQVDPGILTQRDHAPAPRVASTRLRVAPSNPGVTAMRTPPPATTTPLPVGGSSKTSTGTRHAPGERPGGTALAVAACAPAAPANGEMC